MELVVNIFFSTLALISSVVLAWQKLKRDVFEAKLTAKIKKEVEESFNSEIKESKDNVDEKLKDLKESFEKFSDKQATSNEKSAVVDDRVKALYKTLDKFSALVSGNLQKMESNLKEDVKAVNEDCKERDKEVKALITDLQKTKQDKVS